MNNVNIIFYSKNCKYSEQIINIMYKMNILQNFKFINKPIIINLNYTMFIFIQLVLTYTAIFTFFSFFLSFYGFIFSVSFPRFVFLRLLKKVFYNTS